MFGFLILLIIVGITQSLLRPLPLEQTFWGLALWSGIVVFVALASYIAFVRITERRSASELAAGRALPELAAGVGIGAGLFAATIAVMALLGYYTITGMNSWSVIFPALAGAISSGVVEELLFRGMLFRNFEETLGTWFSLLLTALLFGILHLLNPNATILAGIAVMLEAGVLLAAAYLATRRLWLPIGIHFAWNFTQGGIFGATVSGNQTRGLFISTLSGPELLTGGSFGPEASIIAVVICLIAAIWLLRRAMVKGEFKPPYWMR
jgi:membrane protease YdiL (CAAX protease family)